MYGQLKVQLREFPMIRMEKAGTGILKIRPSPRSPPPPLPPTSLVMSNIICDFRHQEKTRRLLYFGFSSNSVDFGFVF
jgi:hypothetical protein